MVDDSPILREVLLRLENVTKAQEATAAQLADLVRTLDDRYVPRREFDLRVGELEKDIEAQASFRRQVAAAGLVGLLLMVANIIVSLGSIPGAGT